MTRDLLPSPSVESESPTTLAGIVRGAVASFLVLTIVTGVVYPLLVTGIAKVGFPHQAEGSLIDRNGAPTRDPAEAVGSHLVGQRFDEPQYFWSRPSATLPMPYNAAASSGSNTGPSAIAEVVKARVDALRSLDPTQTAPIPIDLVTASGSGLDPHISVAAAMYQAPRVARLRRVNQDKVQALIAERISEPQLGALGERVVNVLELNLALDRLAPYRAAASAAEAASIPASAPSH